VTLLLQGGVDGRGDRFDVRTDASTGAIVDVGRGLPAAARDEVLDCRGMVLLPAPAEPHAHLDKALSAARAPNPAGDLEGAIAAWHAYRPALDEEDILTRGRAAAHELIAHGTTAIRTHVDVGQGIGLRAVEAIVALREELRREGLAELQIVALITPPTTGADGAAQRRLLEAALEAGADVVGGAPHLDPDPAAATEVAFDIAQAAGRPVDLHVDETLKPRVLFMEDMIAEVLRRGFAHGAVASHCVSLGVQAPGRQMEVARAAAAAGVAVVTLPQTNLYLQARAVPSAPPRGLTAIRALLDAGATLAAGADNVRDPFNCVGRSDALETAALLVMAAHLTPEEAWDAVSRAARHAMGLAPAVLAPGAPAEVLAVRGTSLVDAVARASEHRFVVHRGRCVARTEVHAALAPLSSVPVLT
jgi:cytosine deaminase